MIVHVEGEPYDGLEPFWCEVFTIGHQSHDPCELRVVVRLDQELMLIEEWKHLGLQVIELVYRVRQHTTVRSLAPNVPTSKV